MRGQRGPGGSHADPSQQSPGTRPRGGMPAPPPVFSFNISNAGQHLPHPVLSFKSTENRKIRNQVNKSNQELELSA